jgi:hypothetical protein
MCDLSVVIRVVILDISVLSERFAGMRPNFEARGYSQVLQSRPNK